MTALTTDFPGNSSRTRIQAMIVPKIALMTTTISEADDGQLQRGDCLRAVTAVQKAPRPLSNDFAATAASGSRTITLR